MRVSSMSTLVSMSANFQENDVSICVRDFKICHMMPLIISVNAWNSFFWRWVCYLLWCKRIRASKKFKHLHYLYFWWFFCLPNGSSFKNCDSPWSCPFDPENDCKDENWNTNLNDLIDQCKSHCKGKLPGKTFLSLSESYIHPNI